MRAEQAARDVLPGHPLARNIDDFLTDLANANKPRNTIRASWASVLTRARPMRLRSPAGRSRR